ncbi:MAG TPA: aminopeptidase [Solirubrobacteraceae bacterium]|nr:aminopeptidase [Solirubrobacteraceae bacterium]
MIDAGRFAELLVGYCLEVQPGQEVVMRSTALAAPLLLACQRAILEREAWPLLRVELPGATADFYRHARDRHLDGFPEVAYAEVKNAQALLAIQAPENTRALSGIDPERLARAARARKPVHDQAMRKRWCSTLWPTQAGAQQAGMSLADFEAFVERALFLDQVDAVRSWGELRAFQAGLIERLKGCRELRIEAPGTDVRLNVKGRTWINSDGRRNMPSGEIFTGPHESSATGRVRFDVPSAPAGVDVAGVDLELRDGLVVAATAERGEEYLQRALATDEGARRLGEIGIGTNFGIDRAIGATLFDEKIGGTVHLALGRSYAETGGRNESALHWDLICDLRAGGRLTADGETIVHDGRFVL